MAGKAALPQPTHHIPAEHPPRHGDRGLRFWTERLGMGRAGARGAMRELADQMQGPLEREHPMMAMVTNGQRTAARPAPWSSTASAMRVNCVSSGQRYG